MAIEKGKSAVTGSWLALIIGNTRLHWGWFEGEQLQQVWHTGHLTAESANRLADAGFATDWKGLVPSDIEALPKTAIPLTSLWIASAVPAQTALWETANVCDRTHIPLQNLYPTLGIDRAINLLGAVQHLGWPVLVIDAGTAITFTAGSHKTGEPAIYGGAILPGVMLQGEALAQKTAALGEAVEVSRAIFESSNYSQSDGLLANRWALDTGRAIASGLIYGTTAIITDYLTDWWQRFPQGKTVLTGGDAPTIHGLLTQRTPAIAARVPIDSLLMFKGLLAYRQAQLNKP